MKTPKLPDNWYLPLKDLSKEDFELCDKWRLSVATRFLGIKLNKFNFLLNNHHDNSYFFSTKESDLLDDFPNNIKITIEQFKEHVLGEKSKREEREEENLIHLIQLINKHTNEINKTTN